MAKRYVLLEPKILEQMQQKKDLERPPDASLHIESDLYGKLSNLLSQSQNLSDEQRVREIQDVLGRFLTQQKLRFNREEAEAKAGRSFPVVSSSSIKPEEEKMSVEEIVSGAPKKTEKRVRSIANVLANNPQAVSWDITGRTKIKGKDVQGNILDYIYQLVKPKTSSHAPPEMENFLKMIGPLPIALSWISNPSAKQYIEDFQKQEGSPISPSEFQFSTPIAEPVIKFPLKNQTPIELLPRKRKRLNSGRSPIVTRSKNEKKSPKKNIKPWLFYK